MRIVVLLFIILAVFLLPSSVLAQGTVVINEFSVLPSDKQDWIELYSPDNVDISGWIIADENGDFMTIPEGTILSSSNYYVVSKYQRLNNDKDKIFLYDKNHQLIDSIAYGAEGEVCLPSANGSIARIPDGTNLIDRLESSTKGITNGESITSPCPSPTPLATSTNTPTPRPTHTPTPTRVPTESATSTSKPTKVPTITDTDVSKILTGVSVTGSVESDLIDSSGSSISSEVLAASSDNDMSNGVISAITEMISPVVEISGEKKINVKSMIAIGLIIVGLACILLVAFKLFKINKRVYTNDNVDEKISSPQEDH